MKVHDIPAAVHPSHGGSSEHLIFRILHPSQARFMSLRPAAEFRPDITISLDTCCLELRRQCLWLLKKDELERRDKKRRTAGSSIVGGRQRPGNYETPREWRHRSLEYSENRVLLANCDLTSLTRHERSRRTKFLLSRLQTRIQAGSIVSIRLWVLSLVLDSCLNTF